MLVCLPALSKYDYTIFKNDIFSLYVDENENEWGIKRVGVLLDSCWVRRIILYIYINDFRYIIYVKCT